MTHHSDASKATSSILLAGIAGFALGVLFAPRSGQHTRSAIKSRAQHMRDAAEQRKHQLKDAADHAAEELSEQATTVKNTASSNAKQIQSAMTEAAHGTRKE